MSKTKDLEVLTQTEYLRQHLAGIAEMARRASLRNQASYTDMLSLISDLGFVRRGLNTAESIATEKAEQLRVYEGR